MYRAYPIERVIVVADRGLLSLGNVAEVEHLQLAGGRSLEYILAVPGGPLPGFYGRDGVDWNLPNKPRAFVRRAGISDGS